MPVSIEGVCYTYPGTNAGLTDINLTIADGELVTLIGASGSGKSTLLKLLAGFIIPDRGRIFINDVDITRLKPEERNLGIVFQNYALFPHMSALQNVAYPLKMRGIRRAERLDLAQKALERVGLGVLSERYPATLSGGQQQRVALARALVFSPGALLLDEPLSALDAALRVELRDEIFKVQRAAGIAALHITHDQEEALSLGDRVAVIADGRLVQVATPQVLYERPATHAIAEFVGNANLWNGIVCAPGRVKAGDIELEAETQGFAINDAVIIMVRPERILPSSADTINTFSGEVVLDRYLGPVRRVDFEIGLNCARLHTSHCKKISHITIPREAIRIFPIKQSVNAAQ